MDNPETRVAVLREAIDRADALASTQAHLIAVQQIVIESQNRRIADLMSQLAEALCLPS